MTTFYESSTINRRARPTQAQVRVRREGLIAIVEAGHPMTVRQVYYQATVRGLVAKTELGYGRVQADLVLLRRSGELPYDYIVDNTRWERRPLTFSSVADALRDAAETYRKSLWDTADCTVQIWLEKDALAGTLLPVTDKYDVSLMVARGYASLSFIHEAAQDFGTLPIYIYHLGDFDPSGVNAGESIEDTLQEMAPGADIRFKRLAVTEQQIRDWRLPTRPTKMSDPRSANFGDISVELDAIEPNRLRTLVRKAIEKHLPAEQFEMLMAEEEKERAEITRLVGSLGRRRG